MIQYSTVIRFNEVCAHFNYKSLENLLSGVTTLDVGKGERLIPEGIKNKRDCWKEIKRPLLDFGLFFIHEIGGGTSVTDPWN